MKTIGKKFHMATRCFLISPTLARFRLTFRACLCTGTMRWKSSISKKGTGAITVDFKSYVVTEGTIALILPGRLHSIEQYMQESMEYENIIFHPGILISKKTDTSNTEFLAPLLSGVLSVPLLYQPGSPCYAEIAACIDANDEISRTNPPGYQFFIKSQLFMLFYILFSKCLLKEPAKRDHKSLEKMKLILKYLENHYMERITIADISAEARAEPVAFHEVFQEYDGHFLHRISQ